MKDEGFRVDTPEKAAWAMRKYRVLAQKKAQNAALAAAEHDRINSWLERVNERLDGEMQFFANHLEGFAMAERAEGRKSTDFPDGALKTRQSSRGVEVDKATFIAWAQEEKREDLLRVSFSPNMTAIKESLMVGDSGVVDPASGEMVPGLSPLPATVSVTIEPDLDAIDLEGLEEQDVE